jgi:hypothetical protein
LIASSAALASSGRWSATCGHTGLHVGGHFQQRLGDASSASRALMLHRRALIGRPGADPSWLIVSFWSGRAGRAGMRVGVAGGGGRRERGLFFLR